MIHIISSVKKIVSRAFRFTNLLEHYIRYKSIDSVLILAYHRINTREYIATNNVMPGMYVSDESFDIQLEWLKSIYKVVSLDDANEFIRGKIKSKEPLCAITFDDGWEDVYDHGFPLLKKHEVPATIFLTGNCLLNNCVDCFAIVFEVVMKYDVVGQDVSRISQINDYFKTKSDNRYKKARMINNKLRKLNIDEFQFIYNKLIEIYHDKLEHDGVLKKYRHLTLEQIKEMQDDRVIFGYHSFSHYMLDNLNRDELRKELEIPINILEPKGIHLDNTFCYPDGKYNDKIISLLKDNNCKYATTLIKGLNKKGTHPYLLKRINVHEGSSPSLEEFKVMLAANI